MDVWAHSDVPERPLSLAAATRAAFLAVIRPWMAGAAADGMMVDSPIHQGVLKYPLSLAAARATPLLAVIAAEEGGQEVRARGAGQPADGTGQSPGRRHTGMDAASQVTDAIPGAAVEEWRHVTR